MRQMIKIIYESTSTKLYGICFKCCCRIECVLEDTTNNTVKCPMCKLGIIEVRKIAKNEPIN
jgi:exosome complex RNA-binding protein Csl4